MPEKTENEGNYFETMRIIEIEASWHANATLLVGFLIICTMRYSDSSLMFSTFFVIGYRLVDYCWRKRLHSIIH